MILLEMINKPRDDYQWVYIYKKYAQIWNVPQKAVLVVSGASIVTNTMESADLEHLVRIRAQYDVEPIATSIDELLHWDVEFTKLVVLNRGEHYIPMGKKEGEEVIPRVIHQVWLGGEMSLPQRYFHQKAARMYPGYVMKLWKEEDITKETFPLTYDLVINLLDFHKHRGSGFSKLATVTDIMRHEILYHEGGFWRDAGMNLFRPVFDQFLRYKLVIGSEKTFRSRWNQGMCFFGN